MKVLKFENRMGHIMSLWLDGGTEEVCWVVRDCPNCGTAQRVKFEMSWKDFLKRMQRWTHGGIYVQAAFPNATADQRELLMSGLCIKCWDNMES